MRYNTSVPPIRFRRRRLSAFVSRSVALVRSQIRKRTVPPPRDLRLRVHLTMLGWFLRDELPKKHPQLFSPVIHVQALDEQGWSNYAFKVSAEKDDYLVRMKAAPSEASNLENWAAYHKEDWILRATQGRLPVARAIGAGVGYVAIQADIRSYAYAIQSFSPFESAERMRARLSPIEFRKQLGALARQIHQIDCTGFGVVFSAATQKFEYMTWPECHRGLMEAVDFGRLVVAGIISSHSATALTERLSRLSLLNCLPKLYHGDFAENWSNILVDPSGKVVTLIDWELAGSGPALHVEFAQVLYTMLRDGRPKQEISDQFAAFLEGYGLGIDEYRERYAYDVESFVLLQALMKCDRYLNLEQSGDLTEHRWRRQFFNRCKELIALGARLSDGNDQQVLFSF